MCAGLIRLQHIFFLLKPLKLAFDAPPELVLSQSMEDHNGDRNVDTPTSLSFLLSTAFVSPTISFTSRSCNDSIDRWDANADSWNYHHTPSSCTEAHNQNLPAANPSTSSACKRTQANTVTRTHKQQRTPVNHLCQDDFKAQLTS